MKLFPAISLVLLGLCQPGVVQADPISREVGWQDAIYAQRSAGGDGRLARIRFENFSNAWTGDVEQDGERYRLVSMHTRAGGDTIEFTSGKNFPKPVQFLHAGVRSEPMMGDGSWPMLARPADIEDGGMVEFDEKNVRADLRARMAERAPFRGVMQRQGGHFHYIVAFEAHGADPAFSMEGELIFGEAKKAFDLATDMQGWHVYRDNTLIKTIPLGQPAPLSAVLSEIGRQAE